MRGLNFLRASVRKWACVFGWLLLLRSSALYVVSFRCRSLSVAVALLLTLSVGCSRQPDAGAAASAAPAAMAPAPAAQAPQPVVLRDSIETTPAYIIGISYPQVASKYPPLAQALHDFAESSRARLMQAVDGLHGAKPEAPFDLSLPFTLQVETPRVVVVGVDGSSYTGGEHGTPLVERFVWLPQEQQMLAAEQLIPDVQNWKPVAAYVRDQLMAQLSRQLDEDDVPPDQRPQLMRRGSAAITAGTVPEVRNFSRFEPVMNADGSIRSLRFVFPPQQVAPYSEGIQSVEVPASVLRPLVATEHRPLFRGE